MPTVSPSSADAAVEARVFWLRFQKEIAAALIILILAIVGFAGYRFYTYRRNSTAADLLGNAKTPQDYHEVISSGGQAAERKEVRGSERDAADVRR